MYCFYDILIRLPLEFLCLTAAHDLAQSNALKAHYPITSAFSASLWYELDQTEVPAVCYLLVVNA